MQFFIEGENALASRGHSFAFADQSPQGGGVTLPTAVLPDWSHRPTFETALALDVLNSNKHLDKHPAVILYSNASPFAPHRAWL